MMLSIEQQRERCAKELDQVKARLLEFERIGHQAEHKGSLSPSFSAKLDELRSRHNRLRKHVRELNEARAQAWAQDDFRKAFLTTWDQVGMQVDELVRSLNAHR